MTPRNTETPARREPGWSRMEYCAALRRQGYSAVEIARRMGVTTSCVYSHIHRAKSRGVVTGGRALRGQPWLKVVAPTLLGKSEREIAAELGLKVRTVRVYRSWAREAGDLPPHRQSA